MRVKTFETKNAEEIERQVNKWLEEHEDIEMIDRTQSGDGNGYICVVIWYEMNPDKDIGDPGMNPREAV